MQRAAQAPQLSLSQNTLLGSGTGQHSALTTYLGFGFNSLIVPSKRFFAAVNIPPLSHLQTLFTACRWVQRCYLLKGNPTLPTKGMMDNGSKHIPKPNLMHNVLHLTPPNHLFCP